MGRAAGIDVAAAEMAELWVLGELLAEDVDARIPEARWREKMKELDTAAAGEGSAAGTTSSTENTSGAEAGATEKVSNGAADNAAPTSAAGTDTMAASAGITNAVPTIAATADSASHADSASYVGDSRVAVSRPIPPPPANLPSLPTSSTTAETNKVVPTAPVAIAPPPRPTTGGKSLEVVKMYQNKVVLKVKRKAEEESDEEDEEEQEEQEEESGSEWEREIESEADKPRGSGRSQRKPKKRRRVVSAPIVNSDGEEELPEEPGWPTEPSRRTCDGCAEGGWTCRVYEMHKRGRQRYACQMCKHVKKRCSIMPYRRREMKKITLAKRQAGRRRRSWAEEEEEEMEEEEEAEEEGQQPEEDEDEDGVAGQHKRQRSRSGTRSNSRRPKKVKFALEPGASGDHQERSQQRRSDRKPLLSQQNKMDGIDGLQAPNKKGKGKAKRRDDTDLDDDGMEVDGGPVPMKKEGEDDMEWQSSEYLLNFSFN